MKVSLEECLLRISFEEPQKTLSWAIYGGGKNLSDTILWIQVSREDLSLSVDPKQWITNYLYQRNFPDAVAMLTSANVTLFQDIERWNETFSVRCISTVGLTNALRVGDPPAREMLRLGTINLLCAISIPLSEEAHLEALSIAAEARTAAVLNAHLPSTESGHLATGTGTDCIVVSAPASGFENNLTYYAGKHTPLGSLIGRAVYDSVQLGVEQWKIDSENQRRNH